MGLAGSQVTRRPLALFRTMQGLQGVECWSSTNAMDEGEAEGAQVRGPRRPRAAALGSGGARDCWHGGGDAVTGLMYACPAPHAAGS